MQDRFKFRIYCKSENKMMLFNNPTLVDGDILQGGLLFKNYDHKIKNVHEVKPEDLILMQCTGLKDKNGNLIFEGDIIKFIKTQPSQVIEICNCGVFFVKRGAFYRCIPLNKLPKNITQHSIDYTSGRFGVDMCTGFHFLSGEVIGNIYQNPELLEEEEQ